MALVKQMDTPPLFCDGTEYAAGLVRRLLGQMIGDTVGLFGTADFAVSLSGSAVTVAPGRGAIPSGATESGVYLVESTEATALTLDPADSTRDRTDRLVAYAVPPVTGADTGKWFMEIRKGTPAATPVPPETPNAYVVWDFAVPAASKGVNPSGFDKRFVGGQQMIAGPTITSTERPARGRPGQIWSDGTTGQLWLWNGSAWIGATDPTLPRGWVGEVKRTTEDTFTSPVLLERLTLSLSASRRYKVTFSAQHHAAGFGPPNGSADIRLAAGTSVSLSSPVIKTTGILKNNATRQTFEMVTTFTVPTSGTYSLGLTANGFDNPALTFSGGNGRILMVEDIGAL
ncbi:hypothetical protein DMH01_22835 [Amycolatopsis sp. WAC 04182]|uniref:hypothetical protein n=1 Tax=Amycolatopsis sp. WAC 04182 TaxID=2203198 RepID=UPI000F7813E8|nr:hypothetical protein [Amycolatopsis sp. WAC 04182]RSN58847.1 hypothetical protein DMH01_22835 [Amycolatopsis sp. WAC 04182]